MVCLPTRASNCLARLLRLRGQTRVPRPPAKITGWKLKFFAKIVSGISLNHTELRVDYILVSGSGRGYPGTYALKNSSAHCGRTSNLPTHAGTTTASPFANVTGSIP